MLLEMHVNRSSWEKYRVSKYGYKNYEIHLFFWNSIQFINGNRKCVKIEYRFVSG